MFNIHSNECFNPMNDYINSYVTLIVQTMGPSTEYCKSSLSSKMHAVKRQHNKGGCSAASHCVCLQEPSWFSRGQTNYRGMEKHPAVGTGAAIFPTQKHSL